ncbi:hypothetical protein OXX80_008392 [Metschnikowia pulcherrima]
MHSSRTRLARHINASHASCISYLSIKVIINRAKMADTEFNFNESSLFSAARLDPQPGHSQPSPQPPIDEQLDFSQSLLFSGQPPPVEASSEQARPTNTSKPLVPKMAKLLDGSSVQLRPRQRKNVVLDLSADPDSILNIDKLYERVDQRKKLRASQERVRNAKKSNNQVEAISSPQLWSEKYKPRSFLQICPAGNERQYRLVMKWLKKWSAVVFGGEKVADDSVDHLGRPARKVLLVHGPPGVGKTAVVHILAHQMGYSVEELNAANSMNAIQGAEAADGAGRFANATAALKLKMKTAMTTNSITSNGKPTCLVIDEIDSSINTGDIVKVISELVRTDSVNSRKREGQDLKTDSRKKSTKKPFTLSRPIICIANDIYNTASRSWGPNPMESLRPLCEIVAFRKPSAGNSQGAKVNASAQKSVKEFLMDISEKEDLGLDRREIAEVFEVCDGDIRACINYLQFSSRKLDSDLHSFGPKTSGDFATKDASVSWFSLVDQIFKRNQNISKEENFEEMLELVSSGDGKSAATGSLDKVIRGCFNKYLDVVHLQDDSPIRPAEISDWLFYYDMLTTQNASSTFYPTLPSLKFWSLFSDINPRKFKDMDNLIPDARNLEFSSRESVKSNRAVMKKLADQIPVESKVSLCGTSSSDIFYACEFVPFLDIMLSPDVGSSKSKTLLKPHEVRLIDKLADLVKSLDIKLESQRDMETNQSHLLYGPDWEGITLFSSVEHNIEQRKRSLNIKRQWLFPLLQAELDAASDISLLKRQRAESTISGKGEVKQKKPRMTSSLDFFKGRYDDLSDKIASPSKTVNREATRIWVKHHEGYSNAVRKNIGWHELWN